MSLSDIVNPKLCYSFEKLHTFPLKLFIVRAVYNFSSSGTSCFWPRPQVEKGIMELCFSLFFSGHQVLPWNSIIKWNAYSSYLGLLAHFFETCKYKCKACYCLYTLKKKLSKIKLKLEYHIIIKFYLYKLWQLRKHPKNSSIKDILKLHEIQSLLAKLLI